MKVQGKAELRQGVTGQWEVRLLNRIEVINALLKRFGKKGKDHQILVVEFKSAKVRKSTRQNAYFYAEVLPRITSALQDQGHVITEEQAKYWLKMKFLGSDEMADPITGEVIQVPWSIADADHDDFLLFVEACIRFGQSELLIRFQTPEEYYTNQEKM